MVSLPQELIDEIVEWISEDAHTLACCSLVSRAWALSSRPHLFHTITINLHNSSLCWSLLQSSYVTFIANVKAVEIMTDDDDNTESNFHWEIISNTPEFPNARTLLVYNLDELSAGLLLWISLKLPGITTLSVVSTQARHLSKICELICGFSFLESLSLYDVEWAIIPPDDDDLPPPPSGLNSLKLSECYKTDVLDWIFLPPSRIQPPDIHTLSIFPVSGYDVPPISHALGVIGSQLHHLTLGFFDLDAGGTAESFLSSIDLRTNPELRTLRIGLELSAYQFSDPFLYIPQIIHQLSRLSSLTTISLWFRILYIEDFDVYYGEDRSEFWNALDLLAKDGQFPALKSLVFGLGTGTSINFDEFVQTITRRLPRFAHRGVLEFMERDEWI